MLLAEQRARGVQTQNKKVKSTHSKKVKTLWSHGRKPFCGVDTGTIFSLNEGSSPFRLLEKIFRSDRCGLQIQALIKKNGEMEISYLRAPVCFHNQEKSVGHLPGGGGWFSPSVHASLSPPKKSTRPVCVSRLGGIPSWRRDTLRGRKIEGRIRAL